MDKKKGISAPKKGMQRNTSLNLLKPDEYTFMLNGNNETETGERLNEYNESSNLLGVNFPEGFKVIGYKSHLNSDTTFFFLTNPITNESSIGYVSNIQNLNSTEDLEINCKDCNYKKILDTPLEGQVQTPSHEYVEIINDFCNGDLNFNINFPIKFIEIKDEKLGRVLYWTDFRSPPRKIEIDNIDKYLYTGNILCGIDNTTPTCIDVSKLLLQPNYSIPKITPEIIQIGGNLKMGTYEFLVAYSDQAGNEISEYYSITNPISIFDENNRFLEQSELDSQTNFAIRLKVEDLDKNFSFYKVVVIERTNLVQGESYFVEGIHSTSDDTIFYTSSSTPNQSNTVGSIVTPRPRTTLENINSVKVRYEKVKGLVTSNNYLFLWGLIGKKEPNLQPIVNLLGAFAKWQSFIAKEDLYKNPIATSKYKTYPRDEVQAFGIRVGYKDGRKSPIFPLVARPSTEEDLEEITVGDKNLDSIEDNAPNCTNTERNKRWQIFNTASLDGDCPNELLSGETVTEETTKTCVVEDVAIIPSETITLQIDEPYTNLANYLNENFDEITDPLSEKYLPTIATYLTGEYPDAHCLPNFGTLLTSGELIVGQQYIVQNLEAGDDFSNVGYIAPNTPFTATATTPVNWTNGSEVIKTNCDSPVLEEYLVVVDEVVNEVVEFIEKEEEDYKKTLPPTTCIPFKIGNTGTFEMDWVFRFLYMECQEEVFKRQGSFSNEDCDYAITVTNNVNPETPSASYYHRYYGDPIKANLLTGKDATATDADFENKIHVGALWYKIPRLGRDKIIFELTKNSDCGDTDDTPFVNKLRYHFFANCDATTPLAGAIVDTTQGILTEIDLTGYPTNEFFVVVDVPIKEVFVPSTRTGNHYEEMCADYEIKYRTAPPCGCFGLYTRDIEYSVAEVTFDSISLNKKETYTATCTYVLPEVDDCDPVAYQYGKFAYWESTDNYPDNEELFNSKKLKISPEDLDNLLTEDKELFESYFTEGIVNNEYELKENTDFRCKPIRHYKFPDNKISPFMGELNTRPFANSVIFPIGFRLDSNLVNVFLEIAVKNSILTEEEKNNIESFEILRADNVVHKSIIAKTVGFDMYKYTENGTNVFYPNYPLNDLGKDLLHLENNSLINHPYSSLKNNKFSVMSPDLFYKKPSLPTEIIIDGYQLGNSRGYFSEVDKHSNWVILGSRGKNLASTLAAAEVALEILIQTSELLVQQDLWITAGVSGGTNAAGFALRIAAIAAYVGGVVTSIFVHYGQYRYQWLQTIENFGSPKNFSSYYVTEGFHNKFLKNEDEDNYLRALSLKKYLKEGEYIFTDENTGDKLKVNNFGREDSVLISLGENHFIEYPQDIVAHDNNNYDESTGSRTIASQNGCPSSISREITRNSALPYITLKNYIPNQFGTINSIKWLTTNYSAKIDENTSCEAVFGGTYVISRDWQHRKLPIFRQNAVGLADRLPFAYSLYPNIASPRFFCDYLIDTTEDSYKGVLFPDRDSVTEFDCKESKMYFNKPSKFYLFYHGFASYLVESEINCNFRYSGKQIEDQYYPEAGDMVNFTQENTRSIFTKDKYLYNNVYSLPVTQTVGYTLPDTYNKEIWDKISEAKNGVIYSLQDNNENSLVDPWTIFKPLNRYEFPTKYGELIQLKDLESATLLGRFENQKVLFNAIDNLADQISPVTIEVGTGGIFSKRPIDFKATDLGYAGTQHSDMVSTPYGHFDVDAKRGKIFQLDQNGRDLQPISDFNNQQESGLKNWFREQLPFKILKQFPNIDIDNKFKGIGISMGWDARHDRVFITKKDYIAKNTECLKFDEETGFYTDCEDPIITCPEGYNYNEETQMCEITVDSPEICPEGYTFDQEQNTCILIEETEANCEESFSIFPINASNTSFTISFITPQTFTVDWGDGIVNSTNTHTYSSPFTGEIKIYTVLNQVKTLVQVGGTSTNIEVKTSELTKLTQLETLNLATNSPKSLLTGLISELPNTLISANIRETTITGVLSDLPNTIETFQITSSLSNPSISGDIADIPSSIINFELNCTNTISGNLTGISDCTLLEFFRVFGTNTISGDIVNFSSTIEDVLIRGNNTIEGDVIGLSTKNNLTRFEVTGLNTISGDVLDLPINLVSFVIEGGNTLSGDINSIPTNITKFIVKGSSTFSYTSGRVWANNMIEIWIVGSLNSTETDNLLIDLANVSTWQPSRFIRIVGVNAPRTATSNTAVATLITKGVTVITN